MTKQEMRKFAQEQISYYQSEIEWTEKQISKINDELKIARKEDKEQKAFAKTYMDGKYAASYEGNYQSEETKKLVNLRRKYQRWIKQYQVRIAQYEQEVAKYTEEAQEATNNETKSKEENTMKNTKSMTKSEAIREISTLSSSILARICGSTNYSIIDDCSSKLILAASSMAENAFEGCENWMDVLDRINVSKDNDVDNYYLRGSMDYREYITKYGEEEAKTILRNYIKAVLNEGIADTKTERDYIRGAKDALCIA